MSDTSSWATVILSVLSLIVSVIALYKSHRANREANAAQLRIVKIEEQRERERQLNLLQAKLQHQLRRTERGSYRLYLINSGMVEARNIRVRLDGKELSGHEVYIRGENMPKSVGPGAEISCLLSITSDCSPPFEMEVLWDDDSSIGRQYRTTLTF